MEVSAYASVGPKLIERGYCAVPAVPGTKVPGLLVGGKWLRMTDWTRRYRDRLPSDREVEGWERAPGHPGICLILGKASQRLIAVDIDVEDAVDPVTRALPYTPVRKRGRKGVTLIFRDPGIPARAFNRPLSPGRKERMVDVLGEGRQTVCPPSIHPDTGKPYVWCGELALEDADIDDIPMLPENALDLVAVALTPLGYHAEVERKTISRTATNDGDKTPHRLLNEHALANLDAWIPRLSLTNLRKTTAGYEAVPDWRASNTGRPISARKLNLKIAPQGIVDFGDGPKGYTAIDLVIAANVAYGDAAFSWLADATGWGAPVFHDPKPRSVEAHSNDPRPTVEVAGVTVDAETGEVIELRENPAIEAIAEPKQEVEQKTSTRAPWKSIEDPLKCPGLVGKIADWIVATADYPQPLLSIGAALSIVGTAAGRQLAGPTKSGTHLYIIGIAGTGCGKDHPLKSIGRILITSKLKHLIGAGQFTSESAVVNTVLRSPSSVCAMDEFGAFLARGKNRSASTHEQGISSMLRKLWGSSFDAVPTTERAGEKFKLLFSPAMTIYGTSTAEELYDAISDQDTRNGLLNRFLILQNEVRPARVEAAADRNEVPAEIVEGLREVYWRLGELGAAPYHGQGDNECATPQIVPWRDEYAELTFKELVADIAARMDKEPEHEKFLVRTAEMAVRMATIRAIGVDPRDPRVTQEDMAWGATVALNSANVMIEGARDRISETVWQSSLNHVVRIIKNKKQCKVSDIQSALNGKIKSREIKEILSDLVEAGRVGLIDVIDRRSETKKTVAYIYLK